MSLALNTRIRLPDGRTGTICWNGRDGNGGVWGEHTFTMPDSGFGDDLPSPQFMLREKKHEALLRTCMFNGGHRSDLECVGVDYEIVGDYGT